MHRFTPARIRIVVALLTASFLSVTWHTSTARAVDSIVTPADTGLAKQLGDSLFSDANPPISFTFDGKPSAEWFAASKPQSQTKALDANRSQVTTTWKDAQSGLTVRLVSVRYADFPAIEWTAYLRNDGQADTKLIENVRGIDAVIGHGSTDKPERARNAWSAGKNFPKAATGERFELYRGWVGNWKPLAKNGKEAKEAKDRWSTGGNAPWIEPAPDGNAIMMMPAQGIEAATDAPTSGKSPGIAFSVPADGVYRVAGGIASTGDAGDGVEWFLHDFESRIIDSGALGSGESKSFDHRLFLRAGDHVCLTLHSRSNPDDDLCRVRFDVTQLSDVGRGDVIIHTNKGSDARDSDYEPLSIGVGESESVALSSHGGRPSDSVTLPYFNIQMAGANALLAIGWPGQWDARFSRTDADVRVAAGQENVHAVLHPGEEIRSPLIALLPYAGADVQRGQNLWRRWMIAHNVPRIDGKPLGPILNANSSHKTAEMIKGNEANQNSFIDRYVAEKLKLDYWWMDAGWYENDGTWVNTGTWKVDRNRFPKGLRAVSDHAHQNDVKTIVWFEPERVTRGTELYNEHPNFLLSGTMDLTSPSAGLVALRGAVGSEPCVVHNTTDRDRMAGTIRWAPRQLSLHPGPKGEFCVARFTVPSDGEYQINATFGAADPRATTDVHVFHGGRSLFNDAVGVDGKPPAAKFAGAVQAKRNDTIDFVVGRGNANFECDTTSLDATITLSDGKRYDVASDFQVEKNPNGAWSYGNFPAGDRVNPHAKLNVFATKDLGSDPLGWKLLNLGSPEALAWITDRVDSMIKSEAIDFYRQDFNIEPLNFWRSADAADRQGMTENLYVQGYLKFWDALHERNPKVWIDSCASGGRRNDLETLRRATPLLRSDRLFFPAGQQGHTYGISQWMPINGTGMLVGRSEIFADMEGGVDPYFMRSTLGPVWTLAADIDNPKLNYDGFRRELATFRAIAPGFYGDYYPLTDYSLALTKWIAWQFDLPEKGEGFIQAFRRNEVATNSVRLKPRGLDRAAKYDVFDVDHADKKQTLTGAQLMDTGLDVTVDLKPDAAIVRYQRQRAGKQ